jgi:cell cycle serine/threonine-protein kinase CDC5/MSD2
MTRWALTDIMAQALRLELSPTAAAEMEPDQLKLHQRLMDKLKYCKEVLASIKNASADSGGVGEEGEDDGGFGFGGGSVGVKSRTSKMSLR